ncbi:MAG: hypothetical protein GX776_04910, partial [Oxalobacter sp.]|nr:hypothetical protein [Oxalobacter sp.]
MSTSPPDQNEKNTPPVSRQDNPYTLKSHLKAWLPAFSLSLSTFIFVSTEFMPVGLLPDMAAGLESTLPE